MGSHLSEEFNHLNFMQLPEMLHLQIFAFMTQKELCQTVAPVCKSWYRLSKDCKFWMKLEHKVKNQEDWCTFREFLTTRSCLKSLKVVFWKQKLTECIPPLQTLKNVTLEASQMNVETLVTNCPLIENLHLKTYDCPENLNHLANLKELQSLTLEWQSARPSRVVQNISVYIMTPNGISNYVNTPEGFVKDIAQSCTKLKVFAMHRNEISDSDFQELCKCRFDTLQSLKIDGKQLTINGMECLPLCQRLHTFHIWGDVSAANTLFPISNLPLKELRITMLSSVPAQDFQHLFMSPSLKNLERLYLNALQIDDKGLNNMSLTCPNLQMIYFHACDNIFEGLTSVVQNCKELQAIHLINLCNVSNNFLQCIPDALPKLRKLKLDGYFTPVIHSTACDIMERMPNFHRVNQDYEWIRQ